MKVSCVAWKMFGTCARHDRVLGQHRVPRGGLAAVGRGGWRGSPPARFPSRVDVPSSRRVLCFGGRVDDKGEAVPGQLLIVRNAGAEPTRGDLVVPSG